MSCEACMGNVASCKRCYACGLKGPAGQGVVQLDPWTAELVRLANEYREAYCLVNQTHLYTDRSACIRAREALDRHAYNGGKAP